MPRVIPTTSCFEQNPCICYGAVREQQRFPRASRRAPFPSGTSSLDLDGHVSTGRSPWQLIQHESHTRGLRDLPFGWLIHSTRAIACYQGPQTSSSKRMIPMSPLSNVAFPDRDRSIPRDARGVNVKHFRQPREGRTTDRNSASTGTSRRLVLAGVAPRPPIT